MTGTRIRPSICGRRSSCRKPSRSSCRRRQQGNIINLIDQRVWKLNPQYFSYTASKGGLWVVTQTMAQALAPRIRVNAIAPGPALPNVRMRAKEFEKLTAADATEARDEP